MTKKTENYEIDLLADILSEITPQEQAKTDKRMLLALKIAEAMKRKGLNKIGLSKLMGKQPSVITKWLSGTHNFESDTLFDLEYHLGTQLIDVEEKQKEQVIKFQLVVSQKITSESYVDPVNEIRQTKPYATWATNNQGSC